MKACVSTSLSRSGGCWYLLSCLNCMSLELKARSRIVPGSLLCSLDEYNLYVIVLVLYQQSCRDSWILFYLSCCIFSWLRSSLWLQFKPHHIAAGAVYLAAKFLNLDLTSYQNIWLEFKATPSIIQDVSQQLMELF